MTIMISTQPNYGYFSMIDPIFFIANIRLPTEKAHGIQIMKMCEAFATRGHAVTLIVPDRKNLLQEDPFVYYSVKKNFEIKKVFLLGSVEWGKMGFFLQSISFGLRAALTVFRQPNSIIYSRDESALFFVSVFSGRFFWESHTPKNNFLIRWVVRRAKGIVVISGGLRKLYELQGVPSKKILVAHDAVDLTQFNIRESRDSCRNKLNLPIEREIVAYVGKITTMSVEKGVDQLIGAFLETKKELSKAFLLLVGANPWEISPVKDRLIAAGMSDKDFKIVPHIYQREIPFYLRAADVLIMNYPAAVHYALYMSPLKLFEYLASGTPIISSDLPVIREVVDEKSVFFVEPGSQESLRAVIVYVLGHKDKANVAAQNALDVVQKYTWNERLVHVEDFMLDNL